jgi:multicomponent Na+:H+ antiporter subunit B
MINRPQEGMTLIVKTITRLTVGLILIFGIYIVLHGHLTPGGGFAGGVIIALSFIHLLLAFGKDLALKKMSRSAASYFEGFGATMFIAIALLGFAAIFGKDAAGFFFKNFFPGKGDPYDLFSSGSIILSNIAICLKVGAGLFAVLVALVFLRANPEEKK